MYGAIVIYFEMFTADGARKGIMPVTRILHVMPLLAMSQPGESQN